MHECSKTEVTYPKVGRRVRGHHFSQVGFQGFEDELQIDGRV